MELPMDPVEFARLQAIYESVKHIPSDTESLRDDDYLLLGRFVQVFCVADLESRRVIAAMQAIVGNKSVDVRKLPDKTVIEHLAISARDWPGQKAIGKGLAAVADIFSKHHHVRNICAHWAARRIKGHDAYFFISTSGNHKPPLGGYHVGPDDPDADAEFRMLEKNVIMEELIKLQHHATFLGSLAPHLENNIVALKKQHGAK